MTSKGHHPCEPEYRTEDGEGIGFELPSLGSVEF